MWLVLSRLVRLLKLQLDVIRSPVEEKRGGVAFFCWHAASKYRYLAISKLLSKATQYGDYLFRDSI